MISIGKERGEGGEEEGKYIYIYININNNNKKRDSIYDVKNIVDAPQRMLGGKEKKVKPHPPTPTDAITLIAF